MTTIGDARRLLLISNSTLYGRGYLDHVEQEIRAFVGKRTRVLFVPFALLDRRAYTVKAQVRLREMGLSLASIHDVSNMPRAIERPRSFLLVVAIRSACGDGRFASRIGGGCSNPCRCDVHAELGEVVAGKKPGRESEEEITIFDSTGMALQDVAAAAMLYEKAERQGSGLRPSFAA